jgi:hypothetical protein
MTDLTEHNPIFIRDADGEGWHIAGDNCYYPDRVDLIHTGILGHCGCGCPELILKTLLHKLRDLNNLRNTDTPDQWLWLYTIDRAELTEHGVGLPGWLSERGQAVLKLLEELETEGVLE